MGESHGILKKYIFQQNTKKKSIIKLLGVFDGKFNHLFVPLKHWPSGSNPVFFFRNYYLFLGITNPEESTSISMPPPAICSLIGFLSSLTDDYIKPHRKGSFRREHRLPEKAEVNERDGCGCNEPIGQFSQYSPNSWEQNKINLF